jgi:hypothetical protein
VGRGPFAACRVGPVFSYSPDVVNNGPDAVDRLTFIDVRLGPELQRLSIVYADNNLVESVLREFERQISELAAAAMRTRKPIAF